MRNYDFKNNNYRTFLIKWLHLLSFYLLGLLAFRLL